MPILNLANEIILQILSSPILEKRDLCHTARTCRTLHNLVLPVLYHEIEFYSPLFPYKAETEGEENDVVGEIGGGGEMGEKTEFDMLTLLQTLKEHPERGTFVKSAKFTWYRAQYQTRVTVLKILENLPALRDLVAHERDVQLDEDGALLPFDDRDPINYPSRWIFQNCNLKSLRSLELEDGQARYEDFAHYFTLPGLKAFSIFQFQHASTGTHSSEPHRELEQQTIPAGLDTQSLSNIEELKIIGSTPPTSVLTSLLNKHREIKRFTWVINHLWRGKIFVSNIGKCLPLKSLSKTLVELYFSLAPLRRNTMQSEMDFSDFQVLRVLRTHQLILSPNSHPNRQRFLGYYRDTELSKRLPPSLEILDILFDLGVQSRRSPNDTPNNDIPSDYQWSLALINSSKTRLPNLKIFKIMERARYIDIQGEEKHEYSIGKERQYPEEVRNACIIAGIALKVIRISRDHVSMTPQTDDV